MSQSNLGIVAGLIRANTEARRATEAIRHGSVSFWQARERPGMKIFLSSGIVQVDHLLENHTGN